MSFFSKITIDNTADDEAKVVSLSERELLYQLLIEVKKLVMVMQEETGIELNDDEDIEGEQP